MNIIIIDYGAGNIKSIQFALERLGASVMLSDDPDQIRQADRVIFPGVGEASSAMAKLRKSELNRVIPTLRQPVLGICLGMQLMCNYTEEGNTKGMGIFNTDVIKFDSKLKIPQIGWNTNYNLKTNLFDQVEDHEYMYAVHSYFAPICAETIAQSKYGVKYSTALKKGNFFGVQFHPEKSSKAGAQILKNFLNLNTI